MISKEIRIDCDECGACDNASATSMKEAEKLFLGETPSDHVDSNGINWFKSGKNHYCKECYKKKFAISKDEVKN